MKSLLNLVRKPLWLSAILLSLLLALSALCVLAMPSDGENPSLLHIVVPSTTEPPATTAPETTESDPIPPPAVETEALLTTLNSPRDLSIVFWYDTGIVAATAPYFSVR